MTRKEIVMAERTKEGAEISSRFILGTVSVEIGQYSPNQIPIISVEGKEREMAKEDIVQVIKRSEQADKIMEQARSGEDIFISRGPYSMFKSDQMPAIIVEEYNPF